MGTRRIRSDDPVSQGPALITFAYIMIMMVMILVIVDDDDDDSGDGVDDDDVASGLLAGKSRCGLGEDLLSQGPTLITFASDLTTA